jgi:hypothetical protein
MQAPSPLPSAVASLAAAAMLLAACASRGPGRAPRGDAHVLVPSRRVEHLDTLVTAWELAARDDRPVLRRCDGRALTLRPHAPDTFARGFGWWAKSLFATLRFHRGASGAVTHFTVSTPPGQDSVRDLRFERVTPH